jgi:TonB family protein
LKGIEASLSGQTVVDIPGPGGAVYANYRTIVQTMYDQAWVDPRDVQDDGASVLVEVTINRKGEVISDRIVERSGYRSLDRSVQMALDRVRLKGLPPFPAASKDLQRVFRINFSLTAKRSTG